MYQLYIRVVCVEVNGERVEQVKEIQYLGVMFSGDRYMDKEVEQRIGKASKTIGAFGNTVLGRKEITDEGHEIKSGKCYGDTHLDLWM